MVIALFALSLVMIVGGVAAVVQGFPYVRLESGLAMVDGGTTVAAAGAVLLGIAAAILQMKRLAQAIERRGATASDEFSGAGTHPAEAPILRAPAFEEAPPLAAEPYPALAGAAGLAGVSLGAMHEAGNARRPSLDPLPGLSAEVEPPLPDLLPPAVPGPVPPLAPGELISPEEDLFAPPEDRPGHHAVVVEEQPDPAQEQLALRPALDETAEPAAAEEARMREEEPQAEGLQVVGTHVSGANTYVMFANGTIQADTPGGRRVFGSLEELRDWVASNSEGASRGAA